MLNNMSHKINVIPLKNSKYDTEEQLNSLVQKIESDNPPKCTKYFYINTKGKLSYYMENGWGVLQVWNKGANTWEDCINMIDKTFFNINDFKLGIDIESIQAINRANNLNNNQNYDDVYSEKTLKAFDKLCKNVSVSINSEEENYSFNDNFDDCGDVDSDIKVISATFEHNEDDVDFSISSFSNRLDDNDLVSKDYKALNNYYESGKYSNLISKLGYISIYKHSSDTATNNVVDQENTKLTLIQLFQKHCHPKFLVNEYVSGEQYYVVEYVEYEKHSSWTVETLYHYNIGTVFTNSNNCATKVAEYLNAINVTPNNLSDHFLIV